MKTSFLIGIAVAIVGVSFFAIEFVDSYVSYSLPLQSIEFEEIDRTCHEECKAELESQGYSCGLAPNLGYSCIPPINENKIQERMDYWASLEPVSYGYLDLVYSDRDFQIGLLQNIKIIDENHLEATFAPSENTKYMDAKTIPDDDYVLSKTLATGDTFIPRCNEKNLFVYKLQDIEIREDVSFAVFTYRIGQSDAVPCEFPQILEHSFGVSFE